MSRYAVFAAVAALTLLFALLGLVLDPLYLWPLAAGLPLTALGIWDLMQRQHSLLRNYPLLAHLRWVFEGIRPEIRQYLIESDDDAVPFSREKRSIVYQRAKDVLDKRPFGTQLDVYEDGYSWLTHSAAPGQIEDPDFRVEIGGPACRRPYTASVYNISAMSFGALSGNAIRALNKGAKLGNFAHDTGEGSISRHHRAFGGDLIWELGSGYFGCRARDGGFDPVRFAEQAADAQVKMIEIKLSQGAKPGHGGVLPAAKITPEIAEARGIGTGRDCLSPARHPAFATPLEMMAFIQELRELAEGKPVGFKLCIGHRWEFFALVKAMLETGIAPDFIVVDGKEGPAPACATGSVSPRAASWSPPSTWPGPWRSAPTGATRRAASCSRSAAFRPRPATPTAAPRAWRPKTPCANAPWWSRTRRGGWPTSTATPWKRSPRWWPRPACRIPASCGPSTSSCAGRTAR
jgi:hypothetical protein